MVANPEQSQDYAKKYGQIVAEAWVDPAFKQRLMTDTRAVLHEHGIEVPEGVRVQVDENTEQVLHLLLPNKPQNELTDEQLQAVAGGTVAACAGSTATVSTWCGTFGTISTMGSAG